MLLFQLLGVLAKFIHEIKDFRLVFIHKLLRSKSQSTKQINKLKIKYFFLLLSFFVAFCCSTHQGMIMSKIDSPSATFFMGIDSSLSSDLGCLFNLMLTIFFL